MINYIRREVAAGRDPRPALTSSSSLDATATATAAPWQDDEYLRPVLENDELMFHDWDVEVDGGVAANTITEETTTADDDVTAMLEDMHQMALEDPAVRDLLLMAASQDPTSKDDDDDSENNKTEDVTTTAAAAAAAEAADIDATYFESYSFFDIHKEMLSDRARTETYRDALEMNPSLIKGATVLDLGCGTGVLSMFAARAGAAKVYAVDGSPEIAAVARKICAANGFGGDAEGTITILSSKIENLNELPLTAAAAAASGEGKVDVLVSEWMGYALLFETMLDSVLTARDKFLRPGGAILPDIANIYVAAADEGAIGLTFWDNVYGLDMSVVSDSLRQSTTDKALVQFVPQEHLITEEKTLISLDLATMLPEDQDFSANFELRASGGIRTCAALVIWFDTLFSERFCKEAPQELATGPYGPPTHWAQTVLVLPRPVLMAPASEQTSEAAVAVKGRLSMARREGRHRTLDISVEYWAVMGDGGVSETQVQLYSMGVGEK